MENIHDVVLTAPNAEWLAKVMPQMMQSAYRASNATGEPPETTVHETLAFYSVQMGDLFLNIERFTLLMYLYRGDSVRLHTFDEFAGNGLSQSGRVEAFWTIRNSINEENSAD